jgi:hypothetical protein
LILGAGISILSLSRPILAAPQGSAIPTSSEVVSAPVTRLKVIVTRNGKPLPRWPIRLVKPGNSSSLLPNVGASLTGSDGSILLRGIPAGTLQIQANVPWPGGGNRYITQTVRVASGQLTQATLEIKTGRIMGTARLLSVPVPGALLALRRVPLGANTPPDYFAFADSKGRFSLDVPPGEYYAALAFNSLARQIWSGKITVKEGEIQTLDPLPTIQKPSLIFGTVRKDGKPLPELYLTVSTSDNALLTRVLTKDDGSFLLPVPPLKLIIGVSDFPVTSDPYANSNAATQYQSKTVTIKPSTRNRLDFDLSPRYFEGVVTRNGEPFAGMQVSAQPNLIRGYNSWFSLQTQTVTNSQGRYRLELPPGDTVSLSYTTPANEMVQALTLIPTSANLIQNFAWKPGRLTGTVKDGDGKPLANYPLSLAQYQPSSLRTGPDGSYSIDVGGPTSSGPYMLYGGGLAARLIGTANVTSPQVKTLNSVVSSRPATLEGQVRLNTGNPQKPGPPLPNATIMMGGTILTTDADGQYRMEGVTAQGYSVFVLPSPNARFPYVSTPLSPLATTHLTLQPGETRHLGLLVSAGHLNVKVRVGAKAIVPEYLWARKSNGDEKTIFEFHPDANGEFNAYVPPGPYTVEYAPGPEVVVPGVSPQLASRIVREVEVLPGQKASLQLSVNRLDPAWTTDMGSTADTHAGVTLMGDVALIGSDDGVLTAVQAKAPASGLVLWRYPLNAPLLSRPLAVGNRIFALTADGVLHSLDLRNQQPTGESSGFPVSIGSTEGLLQPVWVPNGGGNDLLAGEVVVTSGGTRNGLTLVNGRTGENRFVPVNGEITTPPLPYRNGFIFGLSDNRTVAMDASGKTLWERDFGPVSPGVYGPVAVSPTGVLVQGTDWGSIEALTADQGTAPKRWPMKPVFSFSNSVDLYGDRFGGVRDAAVPTADGLMLMAPGGDLGLLSIITYNGQVCPVWPWTATDPFGFSTVTPYRYLDSPRDVRTSSGKEVLFATALLHPNFSVTFTTVTPNVAGQPDHSDYGVFVRIPMDHPGNDYDVFYGDSTDQFVGQPVVTGNDAGDVALTVTRSGRLYAFPVQ